MPSDPPLKHSLTTDNINQFFSENSNLSEFEILKELLTEIINLNPNNNSGLYSIYRLLAEKAKFENNILYTDYALRQLSGNLNSEDTLFYYITCKTQDSCNKCQYLDNTIIRVDDFLEELPLPIKRCSNEYLCPIALTVMSERAYLRLKERNILL